VKSQPMNQITPLALCPLAHFTSTLRSAMLVPPRSPLCQ
jgi:hypothetical protein